MINKYNNPRLFNTVLTGPGMEHPRNPHVVIGSDTKGFIQGDLMDANAIMETIDQKIDEVIDGADSDHDTLKEIETDLNTAKAKLSTIETGAQVNPTKLSAFENDLQYVPAPQIGDYLYSDFTWGTNSEAAIGICVGTANMFEDGKARFCQLEVSSSNYQWSTENVDTSLPNVDGVIGDNPSQVIDVTNDTYDGISNTSTLIALGEDKYLAAAYAKTTFNNNGYLPTAKEFIACKENIPSTIVNNNYIWCSSEYDGSGAWYWDKTFNSIAHYGKSNSYKVLGFYAINPTSSEYTFRYVTTKDLDSITVSNNTLNIE